VEDVVDATSLLKDSAFKVLYHIMPGLPGSDRKKDIAILRRIFENERFRPDMLKIYPTLAIKGTKLYEMMKKGSYRPYEAEEAADLIAEMFRYIPKYVRVMRIQRDIPATHIAAGVKKSNLRELVQQKIIEKGIKPLEIRSREIGLVGKWRIKEINEEMNIETLEYEASSGDEYFISYENNETIAGFIRLRIPGDHVFRDEITKTSALVRELHVYGSEERIGKTGKIQHSGIGKMLLNEAEEIAKQDGMDKLVIISGVGAREYYRKSGYKNDGPYISKKL
jgi:elongator complex protein 3